MSETRDLTVASATKATPGSQGHAAKGWRRWSRHVPVIVAALVFGVAIYVLHNELSALSFHQIETQVRALPAQHILLVLLFAALSYIALTNYDRLALNYVGRPLAFWKTASISFTAFAVGHNVGVMTLSGGSIRYRAYTVAGLTAIEIGTVIAFCTLTFAVGSSLLLGIALAIEPSSALAPFGFPAPVLKLLAAILIAVPVVYLLMTLFVERTFTLKNVKLALPDFSTALQQIVFASIDLLASAAIIYILLPADVSVSFPNLLCAYLLAIFLGVVSSVPGGIGVFEGLMLLLLPDIPKAELLGTIVAYRIIYYLLPLMLAMLLMAIQEFGIHRQRVASVISSSTHWVSGIAPQVIGGVVFIAGTGLLISGSLPGVETRLHFLARFIPLPLLETSHLLNSAVGVGLLIVARGLYLRLRGAYQLALLLLGAGIFVSLGKGLDVEESIALLAAAALLWFSRDEFYRPAALMDQRFSAGWVPSILGVLGAALWIGFFVHKHMEYRDALWWQFAIDGNAPRMLRGVLVGALVAAAFGLFRLTRAAPPIPQETQPEDIAKAREIIALSDSSAANVALLGDKRFLFHPSGEAFVMYQVSGDSWIALGDPVGATEHFEALGWQFRELCNRYGDRCAFYEVTARHLSLYVDLGLSLSKLGEEARVPLTDFSLEGSHRAELRQARNRALRNGASFEVIPACNVMQYMTELKEVSNQWLADKATSEKGFSLGAFDPEYLANFDCAIVKIDNRVVAFANLWQSGAQQELSIDLMRYSDKAPKGIMDYLFVELMLLGKTRGFQWFALGMAPLSGLETHALSTLWHKVGNSIFRLGEDFYNFDGLRRYKDKFDPEWEHVYLAAPGGLAFARVLVDSTVLISGGIKQVFKK